MDLSAYHDIARPDAPAYTDSAAATAYRKITLRLIPFLFLCYVAGYLDRINVGFAQLQMKGGFKAEMQQRVNERKLRLSKRLRAYVRRPRMANEMHG